MSIQVSPSPIPNPDGVEIISALLNRDAYLTELLSQCQGLSIQVLEPETNAWLQEVRDRASTVVRQYTLPSTRDEEWRFTDLSSLRQVTFQPVETQSIASLQMNIASLTLPEAANSRWYL